MKHATTSSAALQGVTAVPVEVEVAVTAGLPGLRIMGTSDADALEGAMRVTCAIEASGFQMPSSRVTANLAPRSVRKAGCELDLAIAAGILAATGQVDPRAVEKRLLVGELGLDGRVRPVRGMVPYAILADEMGYELACSASVELPPRLCGSAAGLATLADLARGDEGFAAVEAIEVPTPETGPVRARGAVSDAVSAGRSVLVVGPRRKTRGVAEAVRACLPKLDECSRVACAAAMSAAGLDRELPSVLGGRAPLRAPHHSATSAAMLGGGLPVRPGEVTLAHGGALLLEDLQEWKPSIVEQVAIARDDGRVRIVRADGICEMPSRFQLVATATPCPCGHFGDGDAPCTCGERHVAAYQRKLEGYARMFDEVVHVA